MKPIQHLKKLLGLVRRDYAKRLEEECGLDDQTIFAWSEEVHPHKNNRTVYSNMEHNEINLIFEGGKIDDKLYKLLESIYYIEYPPEFEDKLREINKKLLPPICTCIKCRDKRGETVTEWERTHYANKSS